LIRSNRKPEVYNTEKIKEKGFEDSKRGFEKDSKRGDSRKGAEKGDRRAY
jgi:hypothetical protein